MPTENRSSNTDPRDVFIRLNPLGLDAKYLRKDSTGFEDPRTHSDYLLFLAGYRETHPEPQPHPEPIAWIVGTAFWWTKEEAERDAAATGLPIVGLRPMAGIAAAEQNQGTPVGEVVAFGKGLHEIAWAAGRMPRLGAKLYTHADPGEVERLRRCLRTEVEAGDSWKREALELRQVLESVQEQFKRYGDRFPDGFDARVFRWVDDALSASAEPSAPAAQA